MVVETLIVTRDERPVECSSVAPFWVYLAGPGGPTMESGHPVATWRPTRSSTMNTDHRNENLRRKSFETQSLQAASFDGADLRGADFTMADLSNASFRNARFGVPPSIGAAILAAAIALSLAFGVVAGFAIDAVRNRLYGEDWERTSSAAGILIILVVFVVVLFWKGLDVAIRTYLWTFAVVFTASLVIRLIWGLRRHRRRCSGCGSRTCARARGLVGDRRSGGRWCARSVGYRTGRDHRWARRWPSPWRPGDAGHQRVDGDDLETGAPRRPSGSDRAGIGTSTRGPMGYPVRPCQPDRRRFQRNRRHPLRRDRRNVGRGPVGTGTRSDLRHQPGDVTGHQLTSARSISKQ